MRREIEIRAARRGDASALAGIYSYHVQSGFGTFDEVPLDEAHFAALLTEQENAGDPFLVAVSAAGEAIGFAYAAPFRARPGWRYSYEDQIYLAPGAMGRGVGTKLLTALVEACRAKGVRNLIAVVGDSGNLPSLRVHARLGFAQVGTLSRVGLKQERWLDVVIMQLVLA